jgi:Fe-S-cluster containining protein|tara:strand:+ start:21738 stop:22238 length:501 start_codon:yes stop_codon:yes gene_type:complete
VIYKDILEEGDKIKEQSAKFFKNNKLKGKKLDEVFHSAHEKTFREIDCLSCANCCKTTSPIFRDIDIKRISKSLKTSEKQFISNYLHMDDEGDYVLNQAPCTFLDLDTNKCNIYDIRPLACREYPHTDRKNMHQILDLTQKNMDICPAVVKIVDAVLTKNSNRSRR